jgi:hypothetical protein
MVYTVVVVYVEVVVEELDQLVGEWVLDGVTVGPSPPLVVDGVVVGAAVDVGSAVEELEAVGGQVA